MQDNEKDIRENILAEAKRLRDEEKIVDVDEEKVKLVIFNLQGDYYAFHGSFIKEILTLMEITFVPGTPEYILGLINVRGDVESVLNINMFLGISNSEKSKDSRIIIAADSEIRSGILVDSVEDVIDVPIRSIQPLNTTLRESIKEYVTDETQYKGKNIAILDIGKIFGKISS
jgi:purine-binding chemotaxis protein CheW